MEHKKTFFFLYKHILLAYKWFSIIPEVSLCFSYCFFMWDQFDIYWYILEAGGFCAFMPIFIVGGRGLCPTLALQRGGQGGPFSLLPFSFLPPLFSLLPPLVFFLPPLLRFKVWTFTFRSTKLVPAKIC